MGLVVTFVLGVFVLAGAAVAGFAKDVGRIRDISIAVALGAMAMLLVDDLIPEALEEAGSIGWPLALIGVAAGVLVLVALDRFLPEGHHGFGDEDHCGEHSHAESALHISIATTIALVVHNVVEGMSVYSLSAESLTMAVILGIGVGLHNIPMGMIVYSGLRDEATVRKVVVLAFAVLSTFVGGLVMFALHSAVDERVVSFMICLTIGLLFYIIVFELIPHAAHSQRKGITVVCIALGVLAVAASGLLEGLA
ncbi:MAG: ZIP family metal transporter [Eggerthellaceae bacterium]|nr:ZIP family metal transporter [Eggerthellaceae bacterium]